LLRSSYGVIVKVTALLTPASFAVIVELVFAITAFVLVVNVAESLPAATVTDFGTTAEELLLVRDTTKPPVPAAPLKLTIPVEGAPPATEDGLTLTKASAAGVSVNSNYRHHRQKPG